MANTTINPPVKRRLPGKPRPNPEVLQEWHDATEKLLRQRETNPIAWAWGILLREPTDVFRWRVQFDCGCIEERLTSGQGKKDADDEVKADDPVRLLQGSDISRQLAQRKQLPPGQYLCDNSADHPVPWQQHPLQDIVEWGERREVTFPPDPIEPCGIWKQHPDEWALIRKDSERTSAFYTVKLACGHYTEAVAPDLEWKPEDGLRYDVSPERLQEMRAEIDGDDDFHVNCPKEARRIADGCPRPAPYEQCWLCVHVRSIAACEPVGWLESNEPPPPPPKPKRRTLEARLRKLETAAEQLRKQIEQAED